MTNKAVLKAMAWHRLDVTPMLARVWRSAGLVAQDARVHTGHGEDVGPPLAFSPAGTGKRQPRERHYDVQDPPGTRGRIAQQQRARDA